MPFDATWTKWNSILLGLRFLYFLLKVTPTWQHTKPKNIVVCLDGTSNTPDQLDLGLAAQTNVFKLFSALKADAGSSLDPSGRFDATLCKVFQDKQIALYYTGIGNKYDHDPLVGHHRAGLSRRHAGVAARRPAVHPRFQPGSGQRPHSVAHHRPAWRAHVDLVAAVVGSSLDAVALGAHA